MSPSSTTGAPHQARPAEADAEIHLSVGADMDSWEDRPGFERVAYADGRTDAQRKDYERLAPR